MSLHGISKLHHLDKFYRGIQSCCTVLLHDPQHVLIVPKVLRHYQIWTEHQRYILKNRCAKGDREEVWKSCENRGLLKIIKYNSPIKYNNHHQPKYSKGITSKWTRLPGDLPVTFPTCSTYNQALRPILPTCTMWLPSFLLTGFVVNILRGPSK